MQSFKQFPIGLAALWAVAALMLFSCNGHDSVEPKSSTVTSGKDVIETGKSPGQWTFDKQHCSNLWSTRFSGNQAPLSGRFNSFDMTCYFNQADLSKSWFKGGVILSTFNTGEPGRDAYGKCGPTYLGVKWDTISKTPLVLKPQKATDTAYFASRSVVQAGDGYIAHGDLTFNKVTAPIDMFIKYNGITVFNSANNIRTSFDAHFTMSAKKVFKVTSSSISDTVNVSVSAQMKKNF